MLVEYTQGWLSEPIEHSGNKQASWRIDPAQAGVGGCMGDIGVHAFQLAEFVSGELVSELCADLHTVVPTRRLDDDGTVLLRFGNGATGVLIASQICVGDENNLRLRIYGDRASLDWQQMEPNSLWWRSINGPVQCLRTGMPGTGGDAAAVQRVPAGHPEGYIEAFANLYREFAALLQREGQGSVPGIDAALRGMAFVETAQTEWQAAKTSLRVAEAEAEAQKIKIEHTEASLYGGSVHNPKELQDLQRDVASLKKHLTTLEERQL